MQAKSSLENLEKDLLIRSSKHVKMIEAKKRESSLKNYHVDQNKLILSIVCLALMHLFW